MHRNSGTGTRSSIRIRVVFVISQSGETADTLAALREAANRGATVLGICNAVGSSIARETHGGVYLHAGPEIGVASTKAFTSQLTVLALLTLLLGRMRRISHAEGMTIAKALEEIPKQVTKILQAERCDQGDRPTYLSGTTISCISAGRITSRWRSRARSN